MIASSGYKLSVRHTVKIGRLVSLVRNYCRKLIIKEIKSNMYEDYC